MEESKELATIESGSWGAAAGSDSEDLIIGKALIMQHQSPQVMKKEAEDGEFRNSLDMGLIGKTFQAIIFGQDKVWIEFEGTAANAMNWKRTFAHGDDNRKLAWEEQQNGLFIERQKALNFYLLIADENFKTNLPLVARMKGKSYQTGRRLTTEFAKLRGMNKPSASIVVEFSAKEVREDKFIFYVWDYKIVREATKEELLTAYKWYKLLNSASTKVTIDESEEEGAKRTATATAAAAETVMPAGKRQEGDDDEIPF